KFRGRFLLGRFDVRQNLFPIFFVVVGQDIGIGHAQDFQTIEACHLLRIAEVWIRKSLEPIEIVEDRVIDAVRSARPYIRGRQAQMLEKDSIVGAAAQITDRDVAARLCRRDASSVADCLLRGYHLLAGGLAALAPCLIYRAALRAWHRFRNLADKLLKTWHGGRPELRP